jgi:hypothetical protein
MAIYLLHGAKWLGPITHLTLTSWHSFPTECTVITECTKCATIYLIHLCQCLSLGCIALRGFPIFHVSWAINEGLRYSSCNVIMNLYLRKIYLQTSEMHPCLSSLLLLVYQYDKCANSIYFGVKYISVLKKDWYIHRLQSSIWLYVQYVYSYVSCSTAMLM